MTYAEEFRRKGGEDGKKESAQELPQPKTIPTPETGFEVCPRIDVDKAWRDFLRDVGEDNATDAEVAFYVAYANAITDVMNTMQEQRGKAFSLFNILNRVYTQVFEFMKRNEGTYELFHVGLKRRS